MAMGDKLSLKLVATITVNIVLIIIYACTFGKNSMKKYLEGGLITVKHEEPITSIKPPGMYIYLNLNLIVIEKTNE